MNLKNILLLVSIFFVSQCFSQLQFEEQIIVDGNLRQSGITAMANADFDSDGDEDLVVTSFSGQEIFLYKNTNGLGDYSLPTIIDTDLSSSYLSVNAVDLDNDGDIDILVSEDLGWYENIDGLGTFGSRISISNQTISQIISSDVNSDGMIDIIGYSGNSFYLYKNLGSGNFEEFVFENFGFPLPQIQSAAILDFDLDNDPDLAFVFDDLIVIYENIDGNGSFVEYQELEIPEEQDSDDRTMLQAGDLDNDGYPDLVFISGFSSNVLGWFKNIPSENIFDSAQIIDNNEGHYYSNRVLLVNDIDLDGNMDIVVKHKNSGTGVEISNNIFIRYNLGDGSFSDTQTVMKSYTIFSDDTFGPAPITIADIDNDGMKDFVIPERTSNELKWYKLNTNTNTYNLGKLVNKLPFYIGSRTMVDIDNDGDKDLCMVTNVGVVWYDNISGTGTFNMLEYNTIHIYDDDSSMFSRFAFFGDLDSDGDIDVLHTKDNELGWIENLDGNGVFGSKQIIYEFEEDADFLFRNFLYDYEEDGDLDIIVIDEENNNIALFKNIGGQGNFSPPIIIASNISFTDLKFGDIDNDGDTDIAVLTNPSAAVWYKKNDGEDSFEQILQEFSEINGNVNNWKSNYGDMDGDGDIDFIGGHKYLPPNSSLVEYFWFENDGTGNFIEVKKIIDTSYPDYVSINDFDNDGDQDIVSYGGPVIEWYENIDGQGNFANDETLFSDPSGDVNNYYVEDFLGVDSDFKKDIFFYYISNISWLKNLGLQNNRISGVIKNDINLSGCGEEDITVPNVKVISTSGGNTYCSFTSLSGAYINYVNSGTITTSIDLGGLDYYDVDPIESTSTFDDIGNAEQVDFCLTPNEVINDLKISIIPFSEARPGFNSSYILIYENRGTTILSGEIRFEFDDTKQEFISSNGNVVNTFNNFIEFEFDDINPLDTKSILVTMNTMPPPINENGDVITLFAEVITDIDDITPDDNSFIFEQVLVGSFDPNDIQVVEGLEIYEDEVGDYLHYIIRFQNEGTASAINIRVDNTLDENLDWNTIQLLELSHSGRVEIINENKVSFIFESINLPSEMQDPEGSNGYIIYKIKSKSNLSQGDFIRNKADIFFDFNQPIITNTVTTTIVENLNVQESQINNISIYPNPANEMVFIQSDYIISRARILNFLGQEILGVVNIEGISELDVSKLSSGAFFIEFQGDNGEIRFKKIIIN